MSRMSTTTTRQEEGPIPFAVGEEDDGAVKEHLQSCRAIMLCVIAPFPPLRVAPERWLSASFSYPDEFAIEDFVERVVRLFPEKASRPPLHLLIHSPGGSTASSYVTAKVLRQTFNEIIGFIPHVAASGATVLALSCDKLVMGSISRLTAIDPYYETDEGTVYPLSIVRAFSSLEKDLGTKTLGEISYPYQHFVKSITAEKYDQATHALHMVEKYVRDLMEKANYERATIDKAINAVLYEADLHEEILLINRVREIGLKVENSTDPTRANCWNTARAWLRKYYLHPSPAHVIKYCACDSSPKSNESINIPEDKAIQAKPHA